MTKTNQKTKKILLFAGIIGIPAFLIALFAYGANHVFTDLPYYGPKKVVGEDTVYYKVPAFEFTDHMGNKVNNETLKGKVILMTTAMESCPQNCPMAINQFYQYVYKSLEKSSETKEVMMITHIVSNDSTPIDPDKVIKDLPYHHGEDINFDRWKFVTGDTNPIYDVEIEGKGNAYTQMRDDVIGRRASNALIYLIDHQGHLRGYFPATNNASIMEAERLATLLCIQKRRNDRKK